MVGSKRSKKQVAVDYFKSLGDSTPLRDRIDSLVEYMKIEFVNGQTERVVFNYVRDVIPRSEMPKSDGDIFHKILNHKFLKETEFDRGKYSSADEKGKPCRWDLMNSKEKILKVLPLMDLYTTEVFAANSFAFSRRNGKLYFGKYTADQEVIDNGWLSRFSDGADALKNHFPFLTKGQLEQPISNDSLAEISKCVLSDTEAEEMRGLLNQHGSSHIAFESLKKTGSSSSNVASVGKLKKSSASSNVGGAIFAMILLAFFAYIFLKPGAPSSISTSEASVASASGDNSGYSAGSGSSYDGSSSSVRDSMASETRKKYDNLSSEGKAYVDEQMKKANDFCAKHPDFESCW